MTAAAWRKHLPPDATIRQRGIDTAPGDMLRESKALSAHHPRRL